MVVVCVNALTTQALLKYRCLVLTGIKCYMIQTLTHITTLLYALAEVSLPGLSHDWHQERDQLVEVCMSEAQWATMVSSLNTSGVPCTLTYLMGKQIDRLPEPTDRVNQFSAELSKHLVHAVEQLTEAQTLVATLGLSKVKAEALVSILNRAKSNISGNAKFVAKSFNEHMEKSVEKAKCEANAYLYHVVQRAGLDALTLGITPPKQIEDNDNE